MAHKIREVYIVHHSHTDVGYTDLQEQVIYNQANNIRRAVELIEEGLEKGTNQKDLKWNCETWYCVEQFLKAATKEEKKTFFELVKKNSLFADFQAVKSGQVYTTGSNFYQQSTGTCDFIEDLNQILTGEGDGTYRFLKKLQ